MTVTNSNRKTRVLLHFFAIAFGLACLLGCLGTWGSLMREESSADPAAEAAPSDGASSDPAKPDEAMRARVGETYGKVTIGFEANDGQTDPAVAYYARTFAGNLFVTRDGRIVYSLPGEKPSAPGTHSPVVHSRARKDGWSLTETVVGGRARPSGTGRANTHVSYFMGNNPERWRSDLPTFESVSLGDVWPGISLELQAHGKYVEKLFTVQPAANPSRIRMNMTGARSLRVDVSGALVMATSIGDVTLTPPVAFQESEGERQPVTVAYELHGREYGFRLGNYDPALPVVIDPLLQATYLGGSGSDEALALAINPTTGDVYLAGDTNSTNFPGTAGGAQAANGGGGDAYIARFNATLTSLIQTTYLGGSDEDQANALAIHPTTSDVYVTGGTRSTNFPGTTGGSQSTIGGGSDAFIVRLNSTLTSLTQATYLGGSGEDVGSAFAINPTTGDLYVAGATQSTNFPGTTGGAQATNGGGLDDAVVARLNSTLTSLTQSTYLGGSSYDFANALAINPTTGDVYLAGDTDSTNFPGTTGGAQAANGGGFDDAFVVRINPTLTSLTQGTYLGGSGSDFDSALAIHPTTGDVYVAGRTFSTNFPGTTGGAQAANGGGQDAFAARLNSTLTSLTQATYLGGGGSEFACGLAIHPTTGDIYVAGDTDSTNFPGTTGGAQPANGGGRDAFGARLNSALTSLTQATYLGGSGSDETFALAIHPATGDVYVAGRTVSTNFPGTAGGAQSTNGGGQDAFVARETANLALSTPTPTATPTPTITPTPTPTPTMATVDGRVLTADGRGLRNATVSITDSNNVTQMATTSSFGFFSFNNVLTGQTYTVRITSRFFRFSPRTFPVNGNLTLADFVGQE